MAKKLHDHFNQTTNTHLPIKILSRKASKTKLKPWLTPGILKSIKTKRSTLTKYNKKKDNTLLTEFKTYRRNLKKTIKLSKKLYYKDFFQKHANNIKKTWKQINHILHRNKTNQQATQLMIDGTLTSDKKKIANAFNKYFTNVASDLSKKIPKTNNSFQD